MDTSSHLKHSRFITEKKGFTLIVVIWAMGLLAVLAAFVALSTKTQTKVTANRIQNAKARALANGAVELAGIKILSSLVQSGNSGSANISYDGTPFRCRIRKQAVVQFRIQDEGGKLNLNTASETALAILIRGFGTNAQRAASLAAAIADFRDDDDFPRTNGAEVEDYRAAGLPYGPKNHWFQSVEELEQVLGFDEVLYRNLRPYLTVYASRGSGIDPRYAPLPLLLALSGATPDEVSNSAKLNPLENQSARAAVNLPRQFTGNSKRRFFSVRADVTLPSGGRFIRDAILEIRASSSTPLRYRSWMQGYKENDPVQKSANTGSILNPINSSELPPC